jgi:hypothetical protein
MKKSPRRRIHLKLSESAVHQLHQYALGATATGVGMLALAHPAEAKIVYTHADTSIPVNGGLIELDLNHDGVNDFRFSNVYKTSTRKGSHLHDSSLNVAPAQTLNRVVRHPSRRKAWAAALPKGAKIGINDPFQPGRYTLPMVEGRDNWTSKGTYGPWIDKQETYLGLEFLIKGEIHFGWARLNVSINSGSCKGICATLTGYAYETVAGKSIIAGKTKGEAETSEAAETLNPTPAANSPTLGQLAQGASGLAAWRGTNP